MLGGYMLSQIDSVLIGINGTNLRWSRWHPPHWREIEHSSYNRYVLEQREAHATERRHDLVKILLEKLPESERTVITLYYLGGMKSKEISKFLGVSVHTVTSRLQRARKRLEREEELLVQEVLGGIPISTGLTQNIMQQVAEMKPTPPPAGKPLLPWTAFGTATVFVFLLMLGISNQYLLRFQKPYSFEALSERTIEIIDTPITLTIDSKPAVRTQAGRDVALSDNMSVGLQTSENVLAPNTQNNSFRSSTSQWMQASGPQGGYISGIFATPGKDTLCCYTNRSPQIVYGHNYVETYQHECANRSV